MGCAAFEGGAQYYDKGMKTTPLELSRQLKDSGYPQTSLFMWDYEGKLRVGIKESIAPKHKTAYLEEIKIETNECFASPTADELLERLPDTIFDNKSRNLTPLVILKTKEDYIVEYHVAFEPQLIGYRSENLCDALAKLYLYLQKEGLL